MTDTRNISSKYTHRLEQVIRHLPEKKREEIRDVFHDTLVDMNIPVNETERITEVLGDPKQFVSEFLETRYDQSLGFEVSLPEFMWGKMANIRNFISSTRQIKYTSTFFPQLLYVLLAVSVLALGIELITVPGGILDPFGRWQVSIMLFTVYIIVATFSGRYWTDRRHHTRIVNLYRTYFFVFLLADPFLYNLLDRQSELDGLVAVLLSFVVLEGILIVDKILLGIEPAGIKLNGLDYTSILYPLSFIMIFNLGTVTQSDFNWIGMVYSVGLTAALLATILLRDDTLRAYIHVGMLVSLIAPLQFGWANQFGLLLFGIPFALHLVASRFSDNSSNTDHINEVDGKPVHQLIEETQVDLTHNIGHLFKFWYIFAYILIYELIIFQFNLPLEQIIRILYAISFLVLFVIIENDVLGGNLPSKSIISVRNTLKSHKFLTFAIIMGGWMQLNQMRNYIIDRFGVEIVRPYVVNFGYYYVSSLVIWTVVLGVLAIPIQVSYMNGGEERKSWTIPLTLLILQIWVYLSIPGIMYHLTSSEFSSRLITISVLLTTIVISTIPLLVTKYRE